GTSSFTAAGWNGSFYPKRMRPADYLAFYAEHFHAVEVDASQARRLRNRETTEARKETRMMKLTVIVGGILSVLAFVAHARQARVGEAHPSSLPLANTEAEQRIVSVLDEMVKLHQTY